MTHETSKSGIDFYRVNSDIYGNPRYVVHFLSLLTEEEKADHQSYRLFSRALTRAHKIGGVKYRGRDFGGGIVFQSYSIDDTADAIERVKGDTK